MKLKLTKSKHLLMISFVALIAAVLLCAALMETYGAGNGLINSSVNTPTSERNSDSSPASLWQAEKNAGITGNIDTPAYARNDNGILVENFGAGATVSYKNIIDLSDKKKDDVLLTLFIAPNAVGNEDFKKISIKFTDAENPANFVEITAHQSMWDKLSSFFQVAAPGISGRAYLWGIPGNKIESGQGGCELYTSFNAMSTYNEDGLHRPFSFSYSDSDKTFYAMAPDYNYRPLLKLDDPAGVGAGKEWQGFASGRVKVQITVSDFNSSKGNYIITEFDGMETGGNTITDRGAPSLKVAAEKFAAIPQAAVGKKYPLFGADCFDSIDGKIDAISVFLTPAGDSEIKLAESFFVPDRPGKYLLKYRVSDSAGNIAEKTFEITAVLIMDNLKVDLEFEFPQSVQVGRRIAMPKYSVGGGSGGYSVGVGITRISDGAAIPVTENIFIPDLSGLYIVSYEIKDYINEYKKINYYIKAERGDSPICVFPVLPEAFAGGKVFKLPVPEAYDYTSNLSVPSKPVVKIYSKYPGQSKAEVKDYLFTPAAQEGNVEIIYSVYCASKPDAAVEKIYMAKVVNPKQIPDYFLSDNIKADYNKNYIEFTALASDSSMNFINPLAAHEFALTFEVPKEKNKFEGLKITMTDSAKPQECLQFDIKKVSDSGKSNIFYNGIRYEMEGSFDDLSRSPLSVEYDNINRVFYDYTDTELFKADKTAYGENFYGFSSSKIYFRIDFLNASSDSSAIRLSRIADQSVYADYDRQNNLLDFTDRAAPVIQTEFELSSAAKRYEKVILPNAAAYDVLDPYIQCFLSVSFEDGTKIIDNLSAEDGEYYFYADNYGKYTVSYSASDMRGNEDGEVTFYIYVTDDIPPEIYVGGSVPETVGTNSVIRLPKALAFDNFSKTVLNVFITTPTHKIEDITGQKEYKFTSAGVYKLTYYCFDGNYNYTLKEFTIKVK